MDRSKIEDVLLAMGVPAGIKGFAYIADAVEYVDRYGAGVSVTKELYPEIAEKRDTTASRVERAIRHAFDVARSNKGDREMVEKYIGFMNCANFSSIVMLQKKIKQECGLEQGTIEEGVVEESKNPITALEIREILRQELKMFINDLRELKT